MSATSKDFVNGIGCYVVAKGSVSGDTTKIYFIWEASKGSETGSYVWSGWNNSKSCPIKVKIDGSQLNLSWTKNKTDKTSRGVMMVTKATSSTFTFPKRYRWCITAKIVDAAVEISRLINMANSVYVNPESEHWKADWELRRGYQVQALAQTYSLLTMMDIAYRTFGIEGSKMDYWTGLVINVQNLLRNWKRSDENRYK